MIWPGMPRASFTKIGTYLRDVADYLELRDWHFDMPHEPCDDDAHAMVRVTYGQKHARVYFCSDFLSVRPIRQRHVVVHELIHCHFDPSHSFLEKVLFEGHVLGGQAWVTLEAGHRQHLEFGVDAMASAAAKALPIPDFGTA